MATRDIRPKSRRCQSTRCVVFPIRSVNRLTETLATRSKSPNTNATKPKHCRIKSILPRQPGTVSDQNLHCRQVAQGARNHRCVRRASIVAQVKISEHASELRRSDWRTVLVDPVAGAQMQACDQKRKTYRPCDGKEQKRHAPTGRLDQHADQRESQNAGKRP